MWVKLQVTWLEPLPSGIYALMLKRCFGAYRDDFQGITCESDDELMLSHNQLKVGKSL